MAANSPSAVLVNLPPESMQVVDADEEVFLLYTLLAARPSEPGLGFVDSTQSELLVSFDIDPPSHYLQSASSLSKSPRRKSSSAKPASKHIEVRLAQDQSALRSRKGDTGSVLWRASVHLSHFLLSEHYFPHRTSELLLSPASLQHAHVLELGAGTGLLSVLLCPLVGHYTVTDLPALLPLIRKNLRLNDLDGKASVEELDWIALSSLRPTARAAYFSLAAPADLVLCIDCIYNTSTIPPLIDTLDYVVEKGKTKVLIVLELRDEDVTREFLAKWLEGDGWEVWRFGDGLFEGSRCVMWIGWKV